VWFFLVSILFSVDWKSMAVECSRMAEVAEAKQKEFRRKIQTMLLFWFPPRFHHTLASSLVFCTKTSPFFFYGCRRHTHFIINSSGHLAMRPARISRSNVIGTMANGVTRG
jgi:hypothetical protein